MILHHRHPLATGCARACAWLALAALSLGLTGCSHRSYRDAASDGDQSIAGRVLGAPPAIGSPRGELVPQGRRFFPLAVGNRWDYDVRTRMTLVTSDGPQPPEITQIRLRDEIIGTEPFGAREYFLQQESNPDVSPLVASIFPVREDRSGLYEGEFIRRISPASSGASGNSIEPTALRAYVDRVVVRAADRAAFVRALEVLAMRLAAARHDAAVFAGGSPEGPDAGEISLLRYPLFTGAHWVVRASPRFTRSVIGRERVTVPAGAFSAWRLRGSSELFGPNDRARFWYSSAGLVRLSFHFESNAIDNAGNVIGRVMGDQEQLLTALSLVDPHAPHTFTVGPDDGAESP